MLGLHRRMHITAKLCCRSQKPGAPERGLPQAGEAHLAVGADKRLPQGAGPEEQVGVLCGVAALQLLLQCIQACVRS